MILVSTCSSEFIGLLGIFSGVLRFVFLFYFPKLLLWCVQVQFLGQFMQCACGSSVLSAGKVPVWSRSCQLSTLFLTGKWTEFRLISHTNKVWACSNSSFSSDYSVPFWVCLTVVFSEMADLLCSSAVSCSVYVERFWIKCAECRKWIRNAAEVGSESWGTLFLKGKWIQLRLSSNIRKCSSVPLQQNGVQDTLAALLVHS